MAQLSIVRLLNSNTNDSAFYVDGNLVVDGIIPDPDYTLQALGYTDYAITTDSSDRVRRSVRNPAEQWFATKLVDNYYAVKAAPTEAKRSEDFVASVLEVAQPSEEDFEGIFKRVTLRQPGLRKGLDFLAQHGELAPASDDVPALGTKNVPLPNVGDDVYVDGFNSSFRCVEGGVGRVKLLIARDPDESYESLAKRAAEAPDLSALGQDDDEYYDDEDDEDDFYRSPYSGSSYGDNSSIGETDSEDIFLVLEEAPLDLINWKDVKNRQGELAAIYGKLRVSVVVNKENPEPVATEDDLRALQVPSE